VTDDLEGSLLKVDCEITAGLNSMRLMIIGIKRFISEVTLVLILNVVIIAQL